MADTEKSAVRHLERVLARIKTSPVRGRKAPLTPDQKCAALRLFAKGVDSSVIAESMGVSSDYIRKLASRYQIKAGIVARETGEPVPTLEPKIEPAAPTIGAHLDGYKSAKRGFHIPPEKEAEYTRHLIAGRTIEQAARKVGAIRKRTRQ